jgi:hypothetical protein
MVGILMLSPCLIVSQRQRMQHAEAIASRNCPAGTVGPSDISAPIRADRRAFVVMAEKARRCATLWKKQDTYQASKRVYGSDVCRPS